MSYLLKYNTFNEVENFTMTLTQKLNYVASGTEGSHVIFLHGLGGTTRYWQGRLGALEKSHRVLLVDLLGFGKSPKPWARYTVERHIEALHQTIAEHAPFTLVGHSMGAMLALAYAARYPEQVERVILISLPCFGGREQALGYYRNGPIPERWYLTNKVLAAMTCMITRRVFGRVLPYVQRNLPREVVADTVKHHWLSFTSSLWEVIYDYDLKQDADALGDRIPIICLHGDRDQSAPLEGMLKLAEGRPEWKAHILPGVDHHPLLRAHPACLRAIESALEPNTASRGLADMGNLAVTQSVAISV